MKISVVTAVWNREDTIGQALNSVSSQTYPNVEHIVQDGGSTDRTLEMVSSNAPQAMLVSEKDDGIYDAINRGIERCTGDIIGLMHSDDFFAHKEVLSKVAKLIQDTGADGVYSDLDYVSSVDSTKIVRRWVSGAYSYSKLAKGWMPPHPTVFLKREVYEEHGMYDTSFQIAADYEALLRYLTNGVSLAYLPEVTVKMRLGGASNASLGKVIRKSREDYAALRKNDVGGIVTLAGKNMSKLRQFTF